jgi:hypothetical protein
MNSHKQTPRLLGAMFLIVILVSALGGILFDSVVGTGSISDVLANITGRLTLLRVSILADMLNSLAIVALAAMLYTTLREQNEVAALIALGWWLIEALFAAISRIGAFALIPLSQDFVAAGAPAPSYYLTLAEFLYQGIAKQSYTIHMLFYCSGGLVWYYLFYRSRYVPRVIPAFGLVAASVGLVGVLFQLFGYEVPIFVFLPILPFELSIGFWLLLKGINKDRKPLPAESQSMPAQ